MNQDLNPGDLILLPHAKQRVVLAAFICNLLDTEVDLDTQGVKCAITNLIAKMIDDGNMVGDHIDQEIVSRCKVYINQVKAMNEVYELLKK